MEQVSVAQINHSSAQSDIHGDEWRHTRRSTRDYRNMNLFNSYNQHVTGNVPIVKHQDDVFSLTSWPLAALTLLAVVVLSL